KAARAGPTRSARSIVGAGFHLSIARIAIAPAIKAPATVRGPNRCSLIQRCVTSPTATAGTKATATLVANARDAADVPRPTTTAVSLVRYSTTTATTAPS